MSELLFDLILAAVLEKHGAVEFVLAEPAYPTPIEDGRAGMGRFSGDAPNVLVIDAG
jgi:hypothetical protein